MSHLGQSEEMQFDANSVLEYSDWESSCTDLNTKAIHGPAKVDRLVLDARLSHLISNRIWHVLFLDSTFGQRSGCTLESC